MRRFIILALGFTLLVSIAHTSLAQNPISSEKASLIKEMINMMDSEKMDMQFARQMAIVIRDSYQSTDKTTPPATLDMIENEAYIAYLEAIKSDHYTQGMYSIFDRHYSLEDLKEMVAFYKTPLGQKWLKTMPLVAEDSAKFSVEWNAKITPKIMDQVKTRLDEINKNSQAKE